MGRSSHQPCSWWRFNSFLLSLRTSFVYRGILILLIWNMTCYHLICWSIRIDLNKEKKKINSVSLGIIESKMTTYKTMSDDFSFHTGDKKVGDTQKKLARQRYVKVSLAKGDLSFFKTWNHNNFTRDFPTC